MPNRTQIRVLSQVRSSCALSAGTPSAAAQPTASPRTLAVLIGDVASFDADGGRLGWVTPRARCNHRIHILVLASQRRSTIDGESCRYRLRASSDDFALVGGRAYWVRFNAGNLELNGDVLTAALADRTTRVVATFSDDDRANSGAEPPGLVDDDRLALMQDSGAISRLAGRRAITLFNRTRPVGRYGTAVLGDSLIAVRTNSFYDEERSA